MIEWRDALWAAAGGGGLLALQALGRAIFADVASRVSAKYWGIRLFDRATCWIWFMRDPVWSGLWNVSWSVKSKNFEPTNSHVGQIYRCLNSIAILGSGATPDGNRVPYCFIGKLSREKSVLTGTWFDQTIVNGGAYHGVYQLRRSGTGGKATGLWIGFSETTGAIKSGEVTWTPVGG